MSYDLAVWEGPKPPDDAEAALEYERRMDAMERALDGTEAAPGPSRGIQAFIDAALARFPELDASSLEDEAMGDLVYFPMTFSCAEYARDPLAEIADSLGLVCFDPQIEQMLPDATATPASTITTHAHEAVARHLEEAQRTDSST